LLLAAGVALLLAACHDGPAVLDAEYQHGIAQWRAARVAEMKHSPGRLAYVASGRLLPGSYSVGGERADQADVRLPVDLAELGHLQLGAETAHFAGRDGSGPVPLQPSQFDVDPGTRLTIADGEFFVVRTGPLWGWRYTRDKAALQHPFSGFEHYPLDARWRIKARWKPYPGKERLVVLTSIGTPLEFSMPGEASFWVAGHEHRLRAVMLPEGDAMMFMFSDRTSGRGSYSSGRNLVVALPAAGQRWVELDFNRAENPACALTAHLVCPLAPPESRLDIEVDAGEKTWQAG